MYRSGLALTRSQIQSKNTAAKERSIVLVQFAAAVQSIFRNSIGVSFTLQISIHLVPLIVLMLFIRLRLRSAKIFLVIRNDLCLLKDVSFPYDD